MATEESRLLKKPFDYLSNAALTVDPKSLKCIVVVPAATYTGNSCEDVDQFGGLTLEELYAYLDDPWWKLLRRGILMSFWIGLFAIFALACIISIVKYEQQCTISSMKSVASAIYHASDDAIVRINYTLSANGITSNSTAIQ